MEEKNILMLFLKIKSREATRSQSHSSNVARILTYYSVYFTVHTQDILVQTIWSVYQNTLSSTKKGVHLIVHKHRVTRKSNLNE